MENLILEEQVTGQGTLGAFLEQEKGRAQEHRLPKEKEGKVPGEGKKQAEEYQAAVARAKALKASLDAHDRDYRIMDYNYGQRPGKYVSKAKDVVQCFLDRKKVPNPFDRTKYIQLQGGNGSGKSSVGAYVLACLVIPDDWKDKLGLPRIGKKRNVLILTKSGSNVKDVIEHYLLKERSITRIPPQLVTDIQRRDGVLKGFQLIDGTNVMVGTYDQGREVFQGKNPDFVWMDEEAPDEEVWLEALMRTRTIGEDGEPCAIMSTMTPLAGPGTPMVSFFNEPQDPEVDAKKKLFFFDSRDNPFGDVSLYKTLKGYEFQQRVLGIASSPTGLVYHEFDRRRNVVTHFEPEELGQGTKYYSGLDFGVSHPTAMVFVAVDKDGNRYVYDEWEQSDATIREIAEAHKQRTKLRTFEYHIGDSAAKREALELRQHGVNLIRADKFTKGINGESNRRTGILHVNQLFAEGKLMISERCKKLIKQLETHFFKDSEKDGAVNKVGEDLADAGRYVLFSIKMDLEGTKAERDFKAKWGKSMQTAKKGYDNAVRTKFRY